MLRNTLYFLLLTSCSLVWGAPEVTTQDPFRAAKTVSVDRTASNEEKNQLLDGTSSTLLPPLEKQGDREYSLPKSLTRHLSQPYSIYEVDTQLIADEDFDGFYHYFSLYFDADYQGVSADVYALIYLSLDGGPWNYFHTTDVFTLIGSSSDDGIEIRSVLEEGYPPGYYDVLIELYDVVTNEIVLSEGPYDFTGLSLLPLEDLSYDDYYHSIPAPSTSVTVSYGVVTTGSMELISLSLLGMFGLYRRKSKIFIRPCATTLPNNSGLI